MKIIAASWITFGAALVIPGLDHITALGLGAGIASSAYAANQALKSSEAKALRR